MKKSFFPILVILLTIGIFLSACTRPAPSPTPSQTPAKTPTTSTPASSPTPAQTPTTEPSQYFAGKTITIVVGSAAGGGTDSVARLTALLLPNYLPGKPRVIVSNVPGGGGVTAMNSFYSKAKPDGLTLYEGSAGVIGLQMRGETTVQFDLRNTVAIANLSRGGNIIAIRKDALSRLTDPSAEPVVCGTKDGTEDWMSMPVFGRELLGWNIRWIQGYQGTEELALAIRRGEIDMFGTSASDMIEDLISEGVAQALVQRGEFQQQGFKPRSDYPDVPTFVDVLGNKKPEGTPWEAYLAWANAGLADKFLIAPPGTPPDVANILVNAFDEMSKTPEFDKQTKVMVSPIYSVLTGEDVANILKQSLTIDQKAADYTSGLRKEFGIS